MNLNDVYSFVYRGHLTRTSIALALGKILDNADEVSQIARRLPLDLIDDEIVRRARQMSAVFVAICAFENSARGFIERRLLEEIGDDWWAKCVPEQRRAKAESRRDKENNIRWHARRGESLIEYTEIEDLSAIITTNQDSFLPFVQSVEWSKNIFKTVEHSRNIIMHSGQLQPDDIERLGTAMRDWLNQIGG